MYFEYTPQKIAVLLGATTLLVGATSPLVIAKHTDSETAQAVVAYVLRATADAKYALTYKVPDTSYHSLLAAVAARKDAPASSATERAARTALNVPVLVYHGEGDASENPSNATFIKHMRALHEAGWRTLTMQEFTAFIRGTGTVPEKSFLLTFDDGRRSAFYDTDPLLKDFGYTAVMFVITGFSLPEGRGRPIQDFYLSKTELAYMLESGRWDLESHGDQDHRDYSVPTATSTQADVTLMNDGHFLSDLFWLDHDQRIETPAEFSTRVERDLALSKKILEDTFPIRVSGFAYPLNDFGQDTKNNPDAARLLDQVVPKLYPLAFYQTWSGNGDFANYPNPEHLIKRIEPTESWTPEDLLAVLADSQAKPLPYTTGRFGSDWHSNWGLVNRSEVLELRASEKTTGAAAFLDGTGGWKNYRSNATITTTSGTFSLIARYTDSDTPYVVCAFSDDRIYLEKHTGTALTKIASSRYTPPPAPGVRTVSMMVNGDTVECSAYGVSSSAYVPGIPDKGGIGATVWTPALGSAHVDLVGLTVEEQ